MGDALFDIAKYTSIRRRSASRFSDVPSGASRDRLRGLSGGNRDGLSRFQKFEQIGVIFGAHTHTKVGGHSPGVPSEEGYFLLLYLHEEIFDGLTVQGGCGASMRVRRTRGRGWGLESADCFGVGEEAGDGVEGKLAVNWAARSTTVS